MPHDITPHHRLPAPIFAAVRRQDDLVAYSQHMTLSDLVALHAAAIVVAELTDALIQTLSNPPERGNARHGEGM